MHPIKREGSIPIHGIHVIESEKALIVFCPLFVSCRLSLSLSLSPLQPVLFCVSLCVCGVHSVDEDDDRLEVSRQAAANAPVVLRHSLPHAVLDYGTRVYCPPCSLLSYRPAPLISHFSIHSSPVLRLFLFLLTRGHTLAHRNNR